MAAPLIPKLHAFWKDLHGKFLTDNYVSRLHCRITVALLIVMSTLATARDFFGKPINCMGSGSKIIDTAALNAYCWVFSTFTVKKHLGASMGGGVVYPGVGLGIVDQDEFTYQKYYQWVWLVLCIQAVIIFIPRHLWNIFEGGHVSMAIGHLEHVTLDNYKNTLKGVAEYLVGSLNNHKRYCIFYAVMEVLNLLNVVCQMFLFDFFLGGKLFTYGEKIVSGFLSGGENNYESIMARAFPKLTKCTFQNVGPSGSIQTLDALCILAHNIVNEKIVSFLYFWYFFLIIASVATITYRVLLCEPHIRFFIIKFRFGPDTSNMKIAYIMTKFNTGDIFYLCQLQKNMAPFLFAQLLDETVIQLDMLLVENERTFWKPIDQPDTRIISKIDEERKKYLEKIFVDDSLNEIENDPAHIQSQTESETTTEIY